MTSSTRNASPYIPGQSIQVSRAISQAEFENPSRYALAAPFESGFFTDPGSTRKAICLVNYTGQSVSFILQDPEEFNRLYGDQRFNEKEIAGVTLAPGRCSHFPVTTECYIVSIYEKIIGEDGKLYRQTLLGKRLNELENTSMVITNGVRFNQLNISVDSNSIQDNYFTMENLTGKTVYGEIVREDVAYAKTPEQMQAERMSRTPDLGGNIIDRFKIDPRAKLYYKPPPFEFCVRAIEPYQPQSTGSSRSRTVIVAPVTNYVEEAKCLAVAGDTVVALADENKNGGIILVPYDTKNLKKVVSDIAVSLHSL